MEVSQGQLKVKAVVMTMFDEGDDVIAESGEFKLWCDRENLNPINFGQGAMGISSRRNGG